MWQLFSNRPPTFEQSEYDDRKVTLNWLFNTLYYYEDIETADRHMTDPFAAPIENVVSMDEMVSLIKLPLLERLTGDEWRRLDNHVQASDKSAFIACAEMCGSSHFNIVHESSPNKVDPTPDTTLLLVEEPSSIFSSTHDSTVIVNVELNKEWRSYPDALDAAKIFAARKLAEHVLLCGDAALDYTLKALCIASCEFGVALAFIAITNGSLKVHLTRESANFFNGYVPPFSRSCCTENNYLIIHLFPILHFTYHTAKHQAHRLNTTVSLRAFVFCAVYFTMDTPC